MKKWIIGLSILLGVSAMGSGLVLGKIYHQEMKSYEQQLEEPLSKEALKNIYISTGAEVKLETTEGAPYIELNSKLRGITKVEPEYRIEVKQEGESSYINIEAVQVPEMMSFITYEESVATIYLPVQDINKLVIDDQVNSMNHYGQTLYYNIGDTNVNHLDIDMSYVDMNLNGNYETINIEKRTGDININSKKPAELTLEGSGNVELSGQYKSIDVNNYNGSINIDSEIPTSATIKSGGQVRLKGSYKDIDVQNNYGDTAIQTNTPCELSIYSSGDVQLEGPFSRVDVKSNYGRVNLINTTVPERINLFGNYEQVNVTLPKDIPGFEVTYKKRYEGQDTIYTDFRTTLGTTGNLIDKIQYGDNSSKIMIEGSNEQAYILEGKAMVQ